ncbi:MAG: FUN14 domain-containing protein [Phycisphaerales bacterium]
MPPAVSEQSTNAVAAGAGAVGGGILTTAKVLVVLAVLLMAAGIAAPVLVDGGGGTRTLAMGAPVGADADGDKVPDLSPAVFRLGFSFFAAFCLAYAMRAFFRLAILFLGMCFLLLFGLQYAGLIEVKWGVIATEYDGLASWFSGQTRSFLGFVTGYLPSAGAAAAGLIAGFRRR